jgi:TDG/mug DNA glycosylase family protein
MSRAPLVGHQSLVDWMGAEVLTLADLVPEGAVKAVIVGINPAPPSVAVGHYYQGRLGQQFYARLRQAAVLLPAAGGWEDDEAVASGFAFTDIIKRPTASASEVRPEEYAHGTERLLQHLGSLATPLVLFTFKKTAEVLLGRFQGHGLLPATLGGAKVFVMPGPYAKSAEVAAGLSDLRGLLGT